MIAPWSRQLANLALLAAMLGACEGPPTEQTLPRRLVDELPALGRTYDRRELGALREQPHSWAPVTLSDETRRGFAATLNPGLSLTVNVPSQPSLRLAIAVATLDNEHWSPMQFRILLDTGEKQSVVFTETVARRDRNRWLPREIDLGPWAGSMARLTFETRARGPAAPVESSAETLVPLWGNPVLASAGCCRDRPSIVLISIDCLRADHVGAYGYKRDTTPHIDAFAQDAVLFETALSTAPNTFPAHTSMFTGLYPSVHGANNWVKLDSSTAVLTEILSGAGYQTDGVATGAYISQDFGFERGFDLYRFDHRATAAQVGEQAVELLRLGQGSDQFLFVHLVDPHWPYRPAEEFLDRFGPRPSNLDALLRKVVQNEPPSNPKEVDQIVDLYDAEIASVDRAVGRLLGKMKKMGLYDASLIILTADHGEGLYEHENWQHSINLFEELLRIPLIVKWPGDSLIGRISTPVSQVDILATILESARIAPRRSQGIALKEFVKDTARARARKTVVSEIGWRPTDSWRLMISFRTARLKYIATLSGLLGIELDEGKIEREELYDLIQDPQEQNDLLAFSSVDVEPFRRHLTNYSNEAKAMRAGRQSESVMESDTTLERLRSLGYIQ